MQIGLFEVENDIVIPDQVAVRLLPWMRRIKETFPDNYLQVYAYLFYMSCWDSRNIYLNRTDEEREQAIIEDLHIDFSLDDAVIVVALEKCRKLYETPMVRVFSACKGMMDKAAAYLQTAEPRDGKNGNTIDIEKYMNKLPDWADNYEKLGEKLKKEQSSIRGGKLIAYDQTDQLT